MQISSRFTIAVHILIGIVAYRKYKHNYKLTSERLALSANVNPVIIRRLLQQLKKAGLITVKGGVGGADIAKPLDEITLLDIYNAVECVKDGQLFHFHENPNQLCFVGKNMHALLDGRLEDIQKAMEKEMSSISMQDIMNDAEKIIEVPPAD